MLHVNFFKCIYWWEEPHLFEWKSTKTIVSWPRKNITFIFTGLFLVTDLFLFLPLIIITLTMSSFQFCKVINQRNHFKLLLILLKETLHLLRKCQHVNLPLQRTFPFVGRVVYNVMVCWWHVWHHGLSLLLPSPCRSIFILWRWTWWSGWLWVLWGFSFVNKTALVYLLLASALCFRDGSTLFAYTIIFLFISQLDLMTMVQSVTASASQPSSMQDKTT